MKKEGWFERHKILGTILIVIGTLIVIGIIMGIFMDGGSKDNNSQNSNSSIPYFECGINNCGINTPLKTLNDVTPEKTIVWIRYDIDYKDESGMLESQAGAMGSGVLFEKNDTKILIVTNRHVIDCKYQSLDCFQRISESIKVRTSDGEIHNVSKILFEPHNLDMVILEVMTNETNKYDVASLQYDSPTVGSKVVAIGYPTAGLEGNYVEFTNSSGILTDKREILSSDGFSFNIFDSDAYINSGSSGGGLFFEDSNKLIGITTWGGSMEMFGITSSHAVAISSEYLTNINAYRYCPSGRYLDGDKCVLYCQKYLGKDGVCYDSILKKYSSESA
jgi:S1-C subfamily serine protease